MTSKNNQRPQFQESKAGTISAASIARSRFDMIVASLQTERGVNYAIAVYTLAVILFGVLCRPIGDFATEMDFYGCYAPEAKAILNGSLPIDDWRGPVFPILVALAKVLTGDFFKGGMILAGLASGLVLFSVYRIIRSFSTHAIAGLTLLAIAVNTNFLKYSYTASTDMVFIAFCFGALAVLLVPDKLTWKQGVLAGLLAGAAYLTRYNGIVLLAFFIVLVFVRRPKESGITERYIPLLGFIAAMAILIVPWGLYCMSNRGAFFYNHGYFNIAYEMFGRGRVEADKFLRFEGDKYLSFSNVLSANPVQLITKLVSNFFTHFLHDIGFTDSATVNEKYPRALNQLLSIPFGIIAVGGLITLFKNRLKARERLWLQAGVASYLFFLLVSYYPRYALFLLPIYSYFAIRWVMQTAWFDRKLGKASLRKWVILLATIITFGESVFAVGFDWMLLPRGITLLSPEVISTKHVFTESDRVATQKPHVAYLLGATWVPMPYVQSIGDLLVQLHHENVDYLFFGELEAAFIPKLAPLKDGMNEVPELTPISVSHHPDAAIYQYSHRLDGLVLAHLRFDPALPNTLTMQPAYVDNTDNNELRIDSVKGRNTVFQYTAITSPITVAPKLSALFAIRFRPVETGEFFDTIWVYHSGNLSPGLIICEGSGKKP